MHLKTVLRPSLTTAAALAMCVASAQSTAISDYLLRCQSVGFSGVVLVARGDRVTFQGAYGWSDKKSARPMAKDSVFDVGSLSKQYTAAGILRLRDLGKLSLDDTLVKFFPEVPKDKAGITVTELLHQQSGLDDDYWDQHPKMTEKQYTQMILARPLIAPPGTKFDYSNFNYHLLKQIVERVSREPYERFLHDELFIRAGCRQTGFRLPRWRANQIVRYRDASNVSKRFDASNPMERPIDLQPEGSGGLLASAHDLYLWMAALRSGKLLSRDSTHIMFEPSLGGYACGWYVDTTDRGTQQIYHGGFDTGSGVVSGCYWYPQDELTIILLANSNLNQTLHHDSFVPKIEKLTFGGQVDYPPSPVTLDNRESSRTVGTYQTKDGGLLVVSDTANQLRLSTNDKTAMLALRFGNPMSGGEKSLTARTLAEAFSGNPEPLKNQLHPSVPVSSYVQAMEQMKSAFGSPASVSELYEYAHEEGREAQTDEYVLLQFASNQTILRVRRNAQGQILQITPRNSLDTMEWTLCPVGHSRFRTWGFADSASAEIGFDSSGLHVGNLSAMRISAVPTQRGNQ